MRLTLRQSVEVFHLQFLGELSTKLDRRVYAIKGGCNLRFFFGSIRYSEDLDLDVEKVASGTLKKNVANILDGRALRLSLATAGIEITARSAPKQTDTTQRFKVQLATRAGPAHTKLEFSRRGKAAGVALDRVSPSLTSAYGLSPVLLSHHDRQTAFAQKASALQARSAVQARDVFDLDLLVSGGEVDRAALSPELLGAAAERALSIDYATFESHVVAYLPLEQRAVYGSAEVWDAMCLRVVEALGGAA